MSHARHTEAVSVVPGPLCWLVVLLITALLGCLYLSTQASSAMLQWASVVAAGAMLVLLGVVVFYVRKAYNHFMKEDPERLQS